MTWTHWQDNNIASAVCKRCGSVGVYDNEEDLQYNMDWHERECLARNGTAAEIAAYMTKHEGHDRP